MHRLINVKQAITRGIRKAIDWYSIVAYHPDWFVIYPDGVRSCCMSYPEAEEYRETFGGVIRSRRDCFSIRDCKHCRLLGAENEARTGKRLKTEN